MISKNGLTLIELLICLAIVSILFAIAQPTYHSYQKRNRIIEAQSELLRLQAEMERYAMSYQRYPKSLSQLSFYDEDEQESEHGYFDLFIDSNHSECSEGRCYVLVADPIIEARADERLELYSDGRREGAWR